MDFNECETVDIPLKAQNCTGGFEFTKLEMYASTIAAAWSWSSARPNRRSGSAWKEQILDYRRAIAVEAVVYSPLRRQHFTGRGARAGQS
jgi:hypothetical protein